MTAFINVFSVLFITLLFSGCTLHSKYGDDEEQVIKKEMVEAAPSTPSTTKPVNAFLASLPPDPYFSQTYPPLTPDYNALFIEAMQSLALNKNEQAISQFNQLIALNPLPSAPYAHLAALFKNNNDTAQARAYAKLAIEKNAYNYDAYNILAITAREEGDFKEAEKQYLTIISLWDGYAPAHLNLGILYDLYLGQFDKAIAQYEKYLLIVEDDKKVVTWINDLKRRSQHAPE